MIQIKDLDSDQDWSYHPSICNCINGVFVFVSYYEGDYDPIKIVDMKSGRRTWGGNQHYSYLYLCLHLYFSISVCICVCNLYLYLFQLNIEGILDMKRGRRTWGGNQHYSAHSTFWLNPNTGGIWICICIWIWIYIHNNISRRTARSN